MMPILTKQRRNASGRYGVSCLASSCFHYVDREKAVSPAATRYPHPVADAPFPAIDARTGPGIGKAVKPAFPIGHAGLAPVPRAPSPPRGLPLLLPRAGETVAAGAVHRLARAHAPLARPRRPSVPDRRPARALLRKKRSQ